MGSRERKEPIWVKQRITKSYWVTGVRSVLLFRTADIESLFRPDNFLNALINGLPLRKAFDNQLEKMQYPGVPFCVRPTDQEHPVEVVDCDYLRHARSKTLYALNVEQWSKLRECSFIRKSLARGELVLRRLRSYQGRRYLLGGSVGVDNPGMRNYILTLWNRSPNQRDQLFKRAKDSRISKRELRSLIGCGGLDCSGLLSAATKGWYNGDTEHIVDLVNANNARLLDISKYSPRELASRLKPLDIIVFMGHMMIALDRENLIQAVGVGSNADDFARQLGTDPHVRYDRVSIDPTLPILRALYLRNQFPSSRWVFDHKHFMVVRWHPDMLQQ